jgi:hypothetical protein
MTRAEPKRKLPKRVRQIGRGGHIPAACPSGKHVWLSRQEAVQAGRRVAYRIGTLHAYRCRDCRQYHLTSRP